MSEFQQIKSSNLAAAKFDGVSKVTVKFKSGGTYCYAGITPETYAEFEKTFQTSESSGRFFRENIKSDKFTKL